MPPSVLSDGMHISAGKAAYGNKPIILQVADPAKRGDPDSSSTVLKKGPQPAIWQSTAEDLAHPGLRACAALTVNSNLPVIPSVQGARGVEPEASIPGR